MELDAITTYADWLQTHTSDIIAYRASFDATKVYEIINQLEILKQPAQNYLGMAQETFYRTDSDHKLTLQGGTQTLEELQDRILINHVDGSIVDGEIKFEYNHEDNYAGGYSVRKDLNLISYGLKVLGAVLVIGGPDLIKANLSVDALVSLVVAAAMADRSLNKTN